MRETNCKRVEVQKEYVATADENCKRAEEIVSVMYHCSCEKRAEYES